DGAGKFFGRIAVFFGAFLRDELETAASLTAMAENFAVVTDDEMAVVTHFLIFFKFRRARRTQVSIIPNKVQWRHFAARRKFVSDHGRERISFVVHTSRTGLNAERVVPVTVTFSPSDRERGAKFQCAKNGVHRVATDVTQSPGAEIPPTAPF